MAAELADQIVELVDADCDVLAVACDERGLIEPLTHKGCRVVVFEHSAASLRDRQFDVLVVDLGSLADPKGVLNRAKCYLREQGYVVAAVPNATLVHAAVEALAGSSLDCAEAERRPRRYSWPTVQRLFDELELLMGVVERVTGPTGAAPVANGNGADERTELLNALSRDKEAYTEEFVIRAHPLSTPGLRWIQARVSELVDAKAAARRENAALVGRLEALQQVASSALQREAEQRQLLRDAHEQLLSRDADLITSDALVQERTEWAQSLDRELQERNALVRELQATVEERTQWAQSLDRELQERNALVRELQATVQERTDWTERLDRELRQREVLSRTHRVLPWITGAGALVARPIRMLLIELTRAVHRSRKT